MKTKILFCVIVFVFFSQKSFSLGWNFQNISAGSNNLNGIYAVSPRTCVIAGGYVQDLGTNIYTVFRTTNGGVNWNTISTGGAFYFTCVQFIDSLTGYAGGGAYFVMPENMVGKCVYKTTNGGANWNSVFAYVVNGTTNIDIKDIHFINSQTGWACALDGSIARTTNGGTNFTQQSTATAFSKNSIFFINDLTGWTCGANGTTAKSTNGGANWTVVAMTSTVSLNSIFFADANTGYVCGNGGFIYKTTNGGANWTLKASVSTANMYSLHFYNAERGWVAGTNVVLGTTNGGTSWTMQQLGGTASLNSIHFCDSLNGWACGGNKVLGSVTGGWTSVQKISEIIPGNISLEQNYPNPFNPVTSIKYQVESTKLITLKVYDILGKEVAVLVNEKQSTGSYEVQFPDNPITNYQLPGGVYYYVLYADGIKADAKKMILLK